MSKKNVLIQASHVIFDDLGRAMSPGFQYLVEITDRIEKFVSEGFATFVESEKESEDAGEIKKTTSIKNSKIQETVSSTTQENSNG